MPPFCCRRVAVFIMISAVAAGSTPVAAQSGGPRPAGGIYSCTDAKGRRYTSDRPVPECQDREQRLLNTDGSVRKVVPPTMTPSERAEQEAQEQREAQALLARQEAARRERNLMRRYPNQAAHDAARNIALDDVRQSIAVTERRLAALAAERKPLLDSAAAFEKSPMPLTLRQQLNANEAATRAQRDIVQAQQTELVRLNDLYDTELALLKRLWAGEAPGSLHEVADKPKKAP